MEIKGLNIQGLSLASDGRATVDDAQLNDLLSSTELIGGGAVTHNEKACGGTTNQRCNNNTSCDGSSNAMCLNPGSCKYTNVLTQ